MFGKQDLVDALLARLEGVTEEEARRVVEAIFEAIARLLERDGSVTISPFGTFSTVERVVDTDARLDTDEAILSHRILARVDLRFRPHAGLRNALDLVGSREEALGEADIEPVAEPPPPDPLPPDPEPYESLGELLPGEAAAQAQPSPDRRWDDAEEDDAEGTGGHPPAESGHQRPAARRQSRKDSLSREVGTAEQRYSVVEVCYATDREATAAEKPAERYGSQRGDGSLQLGVCEVSIPEDHEIGNLEGPSWRRFELRPDPEKHVVLLDVEELEDDRFYRELAERVGESAGRQILLFLHGFNVTFEDAARRTAQIAYDLRFEGVPAFYSWPSKGKLSLTGYTHDESNVEWTVPHLEQFLRALSERSGAEAIHLIAHSMGNRALTRALERIAAVMAESDGPAFSEVVLTAPDVDADVFRQLAAAVRRTARRVTLYASEKDRALEVSQRFHGFPRAGDAGDDVVVVPGVDTIDASAVDTDLVGHFYYGDNRSVLSDVFNLLRGGDPPERRFGLRRRESPAGRYWAFLP